jgi:hypothetical protein
MYAPDRHNNLFLYTAFFIQITLVAFFALRKWIFATAMQVGWIIYALAIPAFIISIVLIKAGKPWYIWLGGFLYTGWAIYGYIVDMASPVTWRSPIYWPVFIPYVLFYLSSMMFYWWPIGRIRRPLWFVYAALFILSTLLNISSHF